MSQSLCINLAMWSKAPNLEMRSLSMNCQKIIKAPSVVVIIICSYRRLNYLLVGHYKGFDSESILYES